MTDNKNKGFGSMPEEEVREIGRKGGQSQGQENNPGNFANRDPQDVEEAARKGGKNSHGGGNNR